MRTSRIRRYRPPRILFFGGDDVSLVSLRALVHRLGRTAADHLEVVSPPPAALHSTNTTAASNCKRLPPILQFCVDERIPVTVLNHPRSISQSSTVVPTVHQRSQARFDVAVVCSFRYFIPSSLMSSLPPMINMHPSLLPKYRGASPIFSSMLRGEEEIGVSVIKLVPDELMDSGDILFQRRLVVQKQHDMRTVFPSVTRLGAAALMHVIFGDEICDDVANIFVDDDKTCTNALGPPIWNGVAFSDTWHSAVPQADKVHFSKDPFHAPILTKSSTMLRFAKLSGLECHNIWRTFCAGHFRQASCRLKKHATPVMSPALMERVRKDLAKRKTRKTQPPVEGLDVSVTDAEVYEELTVSFSVVEAKHPACISAGVVEELQSVAATAKVLSPGSAYFPRSDPHIGAIACCKDEVVSWFFWRVATMKNSTPQEVDCIRKGLAMNLGVVYDAVFASVETHSQS